MDTGVQFNNDIICYRKLWPSKGKKEDNKKSSVCPKSSECDASCPNKDHGNDKDKKDKDHKKDKDNKKDKNKKDKDHKKDNMAPIKKPSKNPKNFSDIGKTASVNCCACCQTLAAFLTELLKAFLCLTNRGASSEQAKVGELFCHMMNIMGAIGKDACNFVKLLFRCCIGYPGK